MGQFSDGGEWWWDGKTWVPTTQVVLPHLPPTEFEQSGKLNNARGRMRKSQRLSWANTFAPLAWLTGVPYLVVMVQALRDYRSWTIEQLALATAYLLGPHEPMLAGEGTVLGSDVPGKPWTRDLAVAVTARHVLVFRIDSLDGQPRWIALAGRTRDVKIELLTGTEALRLGPGLTVSFGSGMWTIRGIWGVFKAEPVLDAWRQAAIATGNTG